jgi:hypothetical protein
MGDVAERNGRGHAPVLARLYFLRRSFSRPNSGYSEATLALTQGGPQPNR